MERIETEIGQAAVPRANVDRLALGDRTVVLVGTAHISKSSVALAESVILEERPDAVAVELCESRYRSLKEPDRWKNTDIYSVIKEGRAYVLMSQLVLAAFQKKLGTHLDVKPGAEMMQAVQTAEQIGAEVVLADRDVKVTLKRTWASLGLWSMLRIISAMLAGLFTSERLDEHEIERLKSADALEEMMAEFSDRLPDVRTALIDERDQYLAAKIAAAPGKKVVAIVGAGHVPGIKRWIYKRIDLQAIETIPPPRALRRVIGLAIPLLVIGLIAAGFMTSGSDRGWDMILKWFWATSLMGALGAIIALAHPLTILSVAIAAPLKPLHPFIATGWIAGLVEASIRKPRVIDLERVADDVVSERGIWKNRVSRVLLVIITVNLCGLAGSVLGIYLIS